LEEHPELSALRGEGWAMLSAVLEDCAAAGIEAVTLLDHSFDGPGEFLRRAAAADYTWVIAPESDGILATHCRWIEEAGGRSLNCTPAAIDLAGDKLALGDLWRQRELATPEVMSWPAEPDANFYPAVWKPRDGAGSQATFLVRYRQEAQAAEEQARQEGFVGPAVLQRWVPGQSASVAWLIGPRQAVPLLPARQVLSDDGRFHYRGGELPLPADQAERAIRLSRGAIDAQTGLHGYVGVDLVLGEAADGSQDYLIELNPRLTTSYLGLRMLARFNLMQAILDVAEGRRLPPPCWREETARFVIEASAPTLGGLA
jgi:predicted ATP-grasp superfamily ATP-dependent carboligase